jgi:Zn-dependent protease
LEFTPDSIALAITSYVVLLFSLSVHESAHAWAALRLGDDTAAQQGRITLNPLAHIDPVGTVLMPLLQFMWGGIPLLAWAKPTPVQAANFRAGWFRKGQVLVAGAGPASNCLLALLFTSAFFVFRRLGQGAGELEAPLWSLLTTGIVLNVALAVFNLVPLPPLDGSWIASWGLPRDLGAKYDRLVEPYGSMILLALVATGAIHWITGPPILFLRDLLFRLAS